MSDDFSVWMVRIVCFCLGWMALHLWRSNTRLRDAHREEVADLRGRMSEAIQQRDEALCDAREAREVGTDYYSDNMKLLKDMKALNEAVASLNMDLSRRTDIWCAAGETMVKVAQQARKDAIGDDKSKPPAGAKAGWRRGFEASIEDERTVAELSRIAAATWAASCTSTQVIRRSLDEAARALQMRVAPPGKASFTVFISPRAAEEISNSNEIRAIMKDFPTFINPEGYAFPKMIYGFRVIIDRDKEDNSAALVAAYVRQGGIHQSWILITDILTPTGKS